MFIHSLWVLLAEPELACEEALEESVPEDAEFEPDWDAPWLSVEDWEVPPEVEGVDWDAGFCPEGVLDGVLVVVPEDSYEEFVEPL